MKKVPMRKCVITNERLPKKELIRVVKTPQGEVVVDTTGKVNGHGAYLKKDAEVFQLARKNNALAKFLETEIPSSVYDELDALVK